MKITLSKNKIYKYLLLIPIMKPGLFTQQCFNSINTVYSFFRILVFAILIYKLFAKRGNISASKLFFSVSLYQFYILAVTVCTNPSGFTVWAGPATAIMTMVLLFDYYRDEVIEVILCIANLLWWYFWINEVCVFVCVIASKSTDAGLSFFYSKIAQNQYFLGMDNRFINYFFPTILTNYIIEKRHNKSFRKTFSVLFVGTATLVVLKAVGGIMGMLSLVIVVTAMFFSRRKIVIHIWLTIVFTILVSIVFIWVSCVHTEILYSFFQNMMLKGSNYLDRVKMWKNVLEKVFYQRPLTGIGVQNLSYMRYIMRYNHAHNLIMTLLLQGGIIGEVLWWRSIFIGTGKMNNMGKNTLGIMISAFIGIEFLTNIMDSTNDSYFFILVCVAFYIDSIIESLNFKSSYKESDTRSLAG